MLVPSNASDSIWAGTTELLGLDTTGNPRPRSEYELGSPSDFAKVFADGYHDYASAGIVLGAASGGGDKSLLENAWGKSMTPATLGAALASYWSTVAVQPGMPSHGGMSVAIVVNNASALVGLFTAAVTASMRSTASDPVYFDFVKNIETMAVKNIIWTVTEIMPGTPPFPAAFPEMIS